MKRRGKSARKLTVRAVEQQRRPESLATPWPSFPDRHHDCPVKRTQNELYIRYDTTVVETSRRTYTLARKTVGRKKENTKKKHTGRVEHPLRADVFFGKPHEQKKITKITTTERTRYYSRDQKPRRAVVSSRRRHARIQQRRKRDTIDGRRGVYWRRRRRSERRPPYDGSAAPSSSAFGRRRRGARAS